MGDLEDPYRSGLSGSKKGRRRAGCLASCSGCGRPGKRCSDNG